MIKKEDKTKYKNWIPGDTFAVKIENVNPQYDGKYLILIMFNHPEIENYKNFRYFHVKITADRKKPTTKSEIQKLEDVKTHLWLWNLRFYPFRGMETLEEWKIRNKDKKFYPDKYNYLYTYSVELQLKRGEPLKVFEYIGNFDIKPPKDEFMTENIQLYRTDNKNEIIDGTCDYFVNRIVKFYEDNNLKKSVFFTKEGIKKYKKQNEQILEQILYIDEFKKHMKKD